jgi:hypothetical protein
MPVQLEIPLMRMQARAPQSERQGPMQSQGMQPYRGADLAVEPRTDQVDDAVLGVESNFSSLQTAVLKRNVPPVELLKNILSVLCPKASFDTSPFPSSRVGGAVRPSGLQSSAKVTVRLNIFCSQTGQKRT